MLRVSIQEDINQFQEKIVLGLSKRGLLSVIGAIGTTLLLSLWLWFVFGVNPTNFGLVLMLVAAPFWCIGFIKPKGMYFEDYLPKYIEKKFKDRHLVHECAAMKDGLYEELKKKNVTISFDPRKFKGIEAYCSTCEKEE